MGMFLAIALAVLSFLAAPSAFAIGGCPEGAERLEAYRVCMTPLRGSVGTVYLGSAYDLDSDHAELMRAMNSGPSVPAQVMPVSVGYAGYPVIGAYSYPYSMDPFTAQLYFWASYGVWAGRH